MSDRIPKNGGATEEAVSPMSHLWPSPAYERQLASLREAIGETLYLVEVEPTEITMGTRISGTPYALLDVIDFPRPDPARGIAPHLLLLDDGRGVNLGRIARVSLVTPFNPPAEQILYRDPLLMDRLLLRERRLSRDFIAARSRALLGRILVKPDPPPLE